MTPNKVLHIRVTKPDYSSIMDVVRQNLDKVSHAFDYPQNGRYVLVMHERDEVCSWCNRTEDYSEHV